MNVVEFNKCLEPVYKKLVKALAQLKKNQTLVDRKNARQAVNKAMKHLKSLINTQYPALRKNTQRRKRRTPKEQVRHLQHNGWKTIASTVILERIAAAGIRVKRIRFPAKNKLFCDDGFEVLGPSWAVNIASIAPQKLEAAKRSIRERKAVLVTLALNKEKT